MIRLSAFFLVLCVLQIWISSTSGALRVLQRGSGVEGKYVAPDEDKWAYKPDNRGKYVHVHVPYDGGYGPFKNPYDHDGRPYEHDDNPFIADPFRTNFYDDPKPAIYREYGAPLFNQ